MLISHLGSSSLFRLFIAPKFKVKLLSRLSGLICNLFLKTPSLRLINADLTALAASLAATPALRLSSQPASDGFHLGGSSKLQYFKLCEPVRWLEPPAPCVFGSALNANAGISSNFAGGDLRPRRLPTEERVTAPL